MGIRLLSITLLCFVTVLSQSACMTSSLHSRYRYTEERVSGFYISADGGSLVVIGERYHYVFPLESDLRSVLAWNGRKKVEVQFGHFSLRADARVTGDYSLLVDAKDIDSSNQGYLRSIGFTSRNDGYRLSRGMSGKYYSAKDVGTASSFNKPYKIQLVEESSIPSSVKTVLTPITVTADGVMWLGGIALIGLVCSVGGMVGQKCFPAGL